MPPKKFQHFLNDPNLSCTIRALSLYFHFYAQEIILCAIIAILIHNTVLGNKLLDDAFENRIFVTNFHRYLGGSILVMLYLWRLGLATSSGVLYFSQLGYQAPIKKLVSKKVSILRTSQKKAGSKEKMPKIDEMEVTVFASVS